MSNKLVTNKTSCKKLHNVYKVSEIQSSELYAQVIGDSILLPAHSFVTLISAEGDRTLKEK